VRAAGSNSWRIEASTIEIDIQIDGLPVHLVDTAGLRDTNEAVEQEGVLRTRQAVREADIAILVLEDGADASPVDYLADVPEGVRRMIAWNKIDLSGRPSDSRVETDPAELRLSVKTGVGLPALRTFLTDAMGYRSAGEAPYIARRRHLEAIEAARTHFGNALSAIRAQRSGELIAEDLRLAQQRLGEITGEFTPDDLLGRIFSEFCIGK